VRPTLPNKPAAEIGSNTSIGFSTSLSSTASYWHSPNSEVARRPHRRRLVRNNSRSLTRMSAWRWHYIQVKNFRRKYSRNGQISSWGATVLQTMPSTRITYATPKHSLSQTLLLHVHSLILLVVVTI
jgi:hypothetical protein